MRILLILLLAAVPAVADDAAPVPGRWSGFTVDQLAEHLGLEGGNITFEFDTPVYLHLASEQKEGKDKPARPILDHWTDEPSTRYDLFVKVENMRDRDRIERVHKKVSIQYQRYDRAVVEEGDLTRHLNNDEVFGVGMNAWFETEGGNHRHNAAWRRSRTEASIGEPVTLYEMYASASPEDAFYRLTIRFTESRPAEGDDREVGGE